MAIPATSRAATRADSTQENDLAALRNLDHIPQGPGPDLALAEPLLGEPKSGPSDPGIQDHIIGKIGIGTYGVPVFQLPKAGPALFIGSGLANTALQIHNLDAADYDAMSTQEKVSFIYNSSASITLSSAFIGMSASKLYLATRPVVETAQIIGNPSNLAVGTTVETFNSLGASSNVTKVVKFAKVAKGAAAVTYTAQAGMSIATLINDFDDLSGKNKDLAITQVALDVTAASLAIAALVVSGSVVGLPISGILFAVSGLLSIGSAFAEAFKDPPPIDIHGTAGDDDLDGNDQNNQMWGYGGDDTIKGGEGHDWIWGGEGNDSLYGGAGNDMLWGEGGNDQLFGGEGHDNLDGGRGNDRANGGPGNDTIYGEGGDDYLNGGPGNDFIGSGWGRGNDVMIGGAGDDKFAIKAVSGTLLPNGFLPPDPGEIYRTIVSPGAGNDEVNVSLYKPTGAIFHKTIVSYSIDDSDKSKTWVIDLAAGYAQQVSTWAEAPSTLYSQLYKIAPHQYPHWHAIEHNGVLTFASPLSEKDTLINVENAVGGDGDDRIYGTEYQLIEGRTGLGFHSFGALGNNYLNGGGGNDWIWGRSGNDLLDGGTGRDHMFGGRGNDVLFARGDRDWLDGGDGEDVLNYQKASGVDIDLWDGRRDGPDIRGYRIDLLQKRVLVNDGAQFHDSYAIWVDQIANFEHVVGSKLNDHISGNDADNQLRGGAGNDVILGRDGDDLIDGGTGADRIDGGDGNDTIDGGSGANQIDGGRGDDLIYGNHDQSTLDGGDGNDTLSFARSEGVPVWSTDLSLKMFTVMRGYHIDLQSGLAHANNGFAKHHFGAILAARLANFENVVGSKLDDHISGDAGDNFIFGGDGDDVIHGRRGNDRLDGGAGNDKLNGGRGNDVLDGGAGRDKINGGDGNDFIFASGDQDKLNGGDGGDTLSYEKATGVDIDGWDDRWDGPDFRGYRIDLLKKRVLVNDGASFHVPWAIAVNRAVNFEHVIGSKWADHISGDKGANHIRGGAGNDEIFGRDGNDTLDGGEGADTIDAGAGRDIIYARGDGDTIHGGADDDLVTYEKATAPDGLTINLATGTASAKNSQNGVTDRLFDIENIRGSNANDTIIGNAQNNHIFGGHGDDKLIGGDGNDLLSGGDGNDLLKGGKQNDLLLGGDGNDTLRGGQGKDILDGGRGDDTLFGGDGDDALFGGDGNDTLKGGDGTNILDGGAGRDALFGGKDKDIFVLQDLVRSVDEADVIYNFRSYTSDRQKEDILRLADGTKAIWRKEMDVDGDGKSDVILYNNAEGRADVEGGGVYAVIDDFNGFLADSFDTNTPFVWVVDLEMH